MDYSKEPTSWKVPGGVAAAMLAVVLVVGFIPNPTAQQIISLMAFILMPVFIGMLIWMIVLLIKQRRRSSADGESNNETLGNQYRAECQRVGHTLKNEKRLHAPKNLSGKKL